MSLTAPGRLQQALAQERPLQMVGTVNAYAALMASRVGFRALYLSGAGVANASLGLPDLGMTTLSDVLEDARRITGVTECPLVVDVDTGWGSSLTIARTVKELAGAGVAGIHIEDQITAKRCGQRPGKQVVSPLEMTGRIKAAVDAKKDPDFIVIARTDAVAVEGIDAAVERACLYRDAGADMVFPEALSSLHDYEKFVSAVKSPILANITEFGVTPLFTLDELSAVGVSVVLYPLSAFRAMNAAAMKVYTSIREKGTQRDVIDLMQSREELYDCLHYYDYEQRLDKLYPERRD